MNEVHILVHCEIQAFVVRINSDGIDVSERRPDLNPSIPPGPQRFRQGEGSRAVGIENIVINYTRICGADAVPIVFTIIP